MFNIRFYPRIFCGDGGKNLIQGIHVEVGTNAGQLLWIYNLVYGAYASSMRMAGLLSLLLREAATHPLPGPDGDVPLQALAVKPRLAAMDVAHVEEAAERGIFGGAVVGGHEDVMLGRDGDGDGVVERGRRGIGVPVNGVDADV